ncbi:MAG: PrgI family protein [Propionibacteriaceae bacterium]|jgi:hypothetical protein|nr:PrgI family protein [Propionibacteriaceae bacterium]
MAVSEAAVYSDYTKDKAGVFFGLSGAQLVGCLAAGVPLLAAAGRSDWAGVAAGVVVFAVGAALVAVPLWGRSAFGWAFAVCMFGVGAVAGWSMWRSRAARGRSAEGVDMPGVLQSLEIHDGPPTGADMRRPAVVQNHAARTWAVSAAVTHPGLALAEGQDRDFMGQGLTELLNAAARSGVVDEVVFIVRTVPDDGQERREYLARHTRPDAPPASRKVCDDMAGAVLRVSVRTESFVTVVVREGRLARQSREFGGGLQGRLKSMAMVCSEIEARLRSGMRMEEVRWLTSPELAVAVRTGFAPGDRGGIVAAAAAKRGSPVVCDEVSWPQAGPTGADSAIRHYGHDAWWSCSDTVRLPPGGTRLGALSPVMLPDEDGERRCLMVAYPVVDTATAQRKVRRAGGSLDMAEAANEHLGRRTTAAEKMQGGRIRGLDAKIAEGYALVRPYCLATVTVPRTTSIAERGRRLDSAVRGSGFEPLRLDLSQDVAFAASVLPLGVTLGGGL